MLIFFIRSKSGKGEKRSYLQIQVEKPAEQ
jgi:hypothetical protein